MRCSALPLVTEDRHLLETLRPICDEAAEERGTATGSLRAAVENEAQKLLPHGDLAKRHRVAKSLGQARRTLTRKLVDEGTTYEQVLDQLRQSLARQYIKEQGVSLSQIAWLLGYEGSTSFNHAFRRWTGRSPSVNVIVPERPCVFTHASLDKPSCHAAQFYLRVPGTCAVRLDSGPRDRNRVAPYLDCAVAGCRSPRRSVPMREWPWLVLALALVGVICIPLWQYSLAGRIVYKLTEKELDGAERRPARCGLGQAPPP